MSKRLWLTILFSLTGLLSLVAGVAALTAYAYTNRVPPQVMVAGESLGNLSYNEANSIIQATANNLANQPLVISLEEATASLTLDELGVELDQAAIFNQLSYATAPLAWLSPSYWRQFFTAVNLPIPFAVEEATLLQKIEATLGINSAARDAEVTVDGAALTVRAASNGRSIELERVTSAINQLLASGQVEPVALTYVETPPFVSTETAQQVKTEIESSIQPIHLKFEERPFTIAPLSQYGFVSYQKEAGALKWSIEEAKIRDYLATNVARRLNLKMQPKTILSTTGEVTFPGQDGREVQLAALTKEVYRTITERITTHNQPILIAAASIPYTEKIVHPDFIPGLFEGLYIDINLTKQRLFVINGQTKLAEYLISSGKRGTPTPVGLFYIKNKIDLAQSRLYPGIWMQKWNALARNPDGSGYEGYGLHRVPCFNASCTLRENLGHLGRPASHGCVRVADEGADWIYDNAPVGTPVNIHT